MGLYFIIAKWNEIRREKLLVLQGASAFPALEGSYFWERANRQQQFNKTPPLLFDKKFCCKKKNKPQSRGDCIVQGQSLQRLFLSSSVSLHFSERRCFIPAQLSWDAAWRTSRGANTKLSREPSHQVFFSQQSYRDGENIQPTSNRDRISLMVFTHFWPQRRPHASNMRFTRSRRRMLEGWQLYGSSQTCTVSQSSLSLDILLLLQKWLPHLQATISALILA